ncbi:MULTISPECIES: LysR substrate-binding domain-containing protein [Thioclava]|uniref:LysR substrate-binding domain-containing protein n=1 Tax=Thioclava kandeliae TaxID=3070818 RepID=A0ABV1SDQ7_9RHOB
MGLHRGVKLRHVRAFLDVIDQGSISAAARGQGISQPALSKTLAELEAMLEVELLSREGRSVGLTPAGRAFRRHALQALQQLDTAVVAAQGGTSSDMLNVGLLPTVSGGIFPRAALEFAKDHPGLRMSMLTGPHGFLLGQLRDGRIDLMVGRMPAPEDMPGLRFDFLYHEEIVLVGRAGHPLAGASGAQVLQQAELILPTQKSIIRSTVDRFLLSAGITEPKMRFETVSLAPGLGLVESSDLLWFISRGVVRREIESGTLEVIDLGAPFLAGSVGLTMKQSTADRFEIGGLAEALRHQIMLSGLELPRERQLEP